MSLALGIATAWIALALAWARFRRSRSGPSDRAITVISGLRKEPASRRVAAAVASTSVDSWEGALAREAEEAASPDARASAIDAALADLELAFDGAKSWEPAVPRVAILGGLLAGSVGVIRGAYLQALIGVGLGLVAGGVGAALVRVARTREALQRSRADELAQLLAGGRAGDSAPSGVSLSDRGSGLDRRRGRR